MHKNWQNTFCKFIFKSGLRIRIRWIRKILSSWIWNRKVMQIYGFRFKGKNINQKLKKTKNITLKTQIRTIIEDYKSFLIS